MLCKIPKGLFECFIVGLMSLSIATQVSAQSAKPTSKNPGAVSRLTTEETNFLKKAAPAEVVKNSANWSEAQVNQFRTQRKSFNSNNATAANGITPCVEKGDGCDPNCLGKLCKKAYWFWESDGWCRSQPLNSFGSKCSCSSIKPAAGSN